MAINKITTDSLFQGGRTNSPTANDPGPSFLKYRAALLAIDTTEFQFPTGTSGLATFGIPQTVFVDNALNNFAVDVTVSSTNFSFPVPANSTGFYLIDAIAGDSVSVVSEGNSTGVVEFIFYNYVRTPFVWYKFGTVTSAVTIANGADVALGNTADAALTGPAVGAGTLIALTKGILNKLFGTITVASTVAGENYETVAASQTNQILGGAGAAGDMLDTVTIYPASTSPGNVIVKDGSTVVATFPGGASSVSNLVPFILAFGNARAVTNWNITTGAGVSVVANGAKFT